MHSTTSSNLAYVANLIIRYLRNRKRRAPSVKLLRQMIETAFYASMKSEESRRIACTLGFVDAKNPAGNNPPRIRPQRHSYVRGFGVEITCRKDPPAVFSAGDERASNAKLRPLDFAHFGTRHRSMMRYCYFNPGSVGFVISQDGDVRAIMRIGKKLVLWENVRLQDVEIVKQRTIRK